VIWRRLMEVVRRKHLDLELDTELAHHVEALAAEHESHGLTPEQARRAALRDMGGIVQVREAHRDQRGFPVLESVGHDLRYAMRTFRKSPGFTTVAVLTLALGIGANTAIFSLLDVVLLRSLPIDHPEQLLQIVKMEGATSRGENYSYPQVRAFADQTEVFTRLFGFGTSTVMVGNPDALERAPAAWITGAYYETLGVRAVGGRLLSADDDRPDAEPVAVITDEYWRLKFGRSPRAIGATLRVEGLPVTVVGVTPHGFGGIDVGDVAQITMAVNARPRVSPRDAIFLQPGANWLRVFGRLRPGVTASQATSQLTALWLHLAIPRGPNESALVSSRLAKLTPAVVSGRTGSTPLRDQFRQPLYVLMAIVGLVLLIACANIANLLLARSMGRQRELSARLALGASRTRLIRQLLIESIVLSVAGAIAGMGFAWWGTAVLVDLLSSGQIDPILIDVTPNAQVFLFTLFAALGTALIFGSAPALGGSRTPLAILLNSHSLRVIGSRARLGPVLVVSQVALSILLLIGAGLFVRTLHNLRTLDLGFRPDRVLVVRVDAARAGYTGADTLRLYDELLQTAQAIPGVRSASFSIVAPPSGGSGISLNARVNGLPTTEEEFHVNRISHQFFETLGTPVLEGREFTARDDAIAPRVVVVNQTFADRHVKPGGTPVLGQRVSLGGPSHTEMEIVGVVRDAVYETQRDGTPATIYVPIAQSTFADSVIFEIDTNGQLAQVASSIRNEFQRRLPRTLVEVRTLAAQIERVLVRDRLMATLAVSFGALGLLLAATGLYGLLSYLVVRRTNEIGVRMALGATRGQVMGTVIGSALAMLIIGAVCGMGAAWFAARLIASLLYGVSPFDAWTILGATAVLTLVGAVAACVPAYRAASIDPIAAMQ
jgi:putative ABC transport system permease protein